MGNSLQFYSEAPGEGCLMPVVKAKLLIVDDEPFIRLSMSHALAEIGFAVCCADDGLAALGAIRQAVPDILITDLNMPGMSGFELLSVVHRRLPCLRTIAMSGAFSGNEVPSGVAADAFYQKGSSLGALLQMIGTLSQPGLGMAPDPAAGAPRWAHWNGPGESAHEGSTVACPECLRSFPLNHNRFVTPMGQAECVHCGASIQMLHARFSDRARLKSPDRADDLPIAGNSAPNLTN